MKVGENRAEEGGSERINANGTGSQPNRTADGRFLPGHALPGSGRKPKAVERAYLEAVKEALPPEEIAALLKEALELARETRSWRGMAEVIGIALAYGAGKPTQKTVTTDGNLEQLLAALTEDKPLLPAEPGVDEPSIKRE